MKFLISVPISRKRISDYTSYDFNCNGMTLNLKKKYLYSRNTVSSVVYFENKTPVTYSPPSTSRLKKFHASLRFLVRFASHVFVSFEEKEKKKRKKSRVKSNPPVHPRLFNRFDIPDRIKVCISYVSDTRHSRIGFLFSRLGQGVSDSS